MALSRSTTTSRCDHSFFLLGFRTQSQSLLVDAGSRSPTTTTAVRCTLIIPSSGRNHNNSQALDGVAWTEWTLLGICPFLLDVGAAFVGSKRCFWIDRDADRMGTAFGLTVARTVLLDVSALRHFGSTETWTEWPGGTMYRHFEWTETRTEWSTEM